MPASRESVKFYPVGTQDVKVVSGGGGTEYVQDTTVGAATYGGGMLIGLQATTARAVVVDATGGLVYIGEIGLVTTGTVDVVNTVQISGTVDGTFAGGVQYAQSETAGGATHDGTVFLGVQSTTARAFTLDATGGIVYLGTVGAITTGTMDVVSMPAITGTVGMITTGTVDVVAMPAVSGSVTILSMITGTADVVSMPAVSGSVTILSMITGTCDIVSMPAVSGTISGNVALIANTTAWQGYVIATTSAAAGVIVETSGGHTLYVTDLLVSVDGPMDVDICSETTDIATVYLATKGGFVAHYINPLVCLTNDSLRVVCGSSGKCAVSAQGYTVT